jgi:hypothetical protein
MSEEWPGGVEPENGPSPRQIVDSIIEQGKAKGDEIARSLWKKYGRSS